MWGSFVSCRRVFNPALKFGAFCGSRFSSLQRRFSVHRNFNPDCRGFQPAPFLLRTVGQPALRRRLPSPGIAHPPCVMLMAPDGFSQLAAPDMYRPGLL
jgi:hypothetical protein